MPPSKPPVIIVQPNDSLVYGLRVSMDKGGSAFLPPVAGWTPEEQASQDPQQQDKSRRELTQPQLSWLLAGHAAQQSALLR